ncbi:uncharacterized protein LOC134956764 isoform X2 [Pseudophryne corroboree]|uniref:uncharacterized protein LOC134956764 isoform X2 n=1 Tax=Pseudophryne corroboree TaxID=495146 RepID=UPI003081CC66
MEEGKRMTRNMAKTAASLEKNAYNDHQKRSRNVPGSGDRHDNEEPVVSVRPSIRSFGKGKMKEKKATKTESSDSESDDGSDYDSEGNFREEPKRPPFSEDEEVEEKGNRHQQRDPVNSTLDFDTRPQNRFSDGGVKYQRSVVRRSQATGKYFFTSISLSLSLCWLHVTLLHSIPFAAFSQAQALVLSVL